MNVGHSVDEFRSRLVFPNQRYYKTTRYIINEAEPSVYGNRGRYDDCPDMPQNANCYNARCALAKGKNYFPIIIQLSSLSLFVFDEECHFELIIRSNAGEKTIV